MLLLALAACSAPKANPPSASCGGEPAAVLACVRGREDGVTAMRARFTAISDSAGERTTTSGVVLVAKPDRFRLRLMLPFGLTVFDAVESDGHLQMSLPLQGGEITDAQRAPLPFTQSDLEEAFLRGDHAFPGTCEASAGRAGEVVVRCRRGDGRVRVLHLDERTATITDEASFASAAASAAGTPHFTIAYSEDRAVAPSGAVLPHRIRLAYPARRISLDIEIEKYEVNPALSPALFRPVEP